MYYPLDELQELEKREDSKESCELTFVCCGNSRMWKSDNLVHVVVPEAYKRAMAMAKDLIILDRTLRRSSGCWIVDGK